MRPGTFVAPAVVPFLLAATAAGGAGAQEASTSVSYALLPTSRLEVETTREGFLSRLGHEHLVRAESFGGRVVHDRADATRSSVEVTVAAGGLRVLTPAGSNDLEEIERSMRELLQVERFPEIRFVSRTVEEVDQGVRVSGDLTLVGQTRSITADLFLDVRGDTLWAAGSFTVNQTDFGIRPFSKGMGAVRVGDEITFRLEVLAAADPP